MDNDYTRAAAASADAAAHSATQAATSAALAATTVAQAIQDAVDSVTGGEAINVPAELVAEDANPASAFRLQQDERHGNLYAPIIHNHDLTYAPIEHSHPEYEGGGGGESTRMTGEIIMWPLATEPAGWLRCEGQEVSRTTYADLFALIGTTYGPGDGALTFNVPDLVDRVPIGHGIEPIATKGGANSRTIGLAQMPAHVHTMNHNHPSTTVSGGGHTHSWATHSSNDDGINNSVKRDGAGPDSDGYDSIGSSGGHNHTVNTPTHTGNTGSAGSGDPLDVRSAFTSLRFLIKT